MPGVVAQARLKRRCRLPPSSAPIRRRPPSESRRAQQAGAVRNGVELPEVWALLVGTSRTAAHTPLDAGEHSHMLGIVFAGPAPVAGNPQGASDGSGNGRAGRTVEESVTRFFPQQQRNPRERRRTLRPAQGSRPQPPPAGQPRTRSPQRHLDPYPGPHHSGKRPPCHTGGRPSP
ncbi:hypothetical protein AB5J72_47375 [Streptomyces sp. CG1]|uniref:SbtR family transcriptional regulator n=1 Tax=Streptomyces sp. CG1 TaxID=1287523 RepID=UPI0034E2251E